MSVDDVTDEDIRALRTDAAAHGDALQVKLCDHALETHDSEDGEDGSPDMTATSIALAREDCARVIRYTRSRASE